MEIHYRLGVLYEDTGVRDKARVHLEQFVESFTDPQPNSTVYNDAKARLRRLSSVRSPTGMPAPTM